jgi:hypothetical protein
MRHIWNTLSRAAVSHDFEAKYMHMISNFQEQKVRNHNKSLTSPGTRANWLGNVTQSSRPHLGRKKRRDVILDFRLNHTRTFLQTKTGSYQKLRQPIGSGFYSTVQSKAVSFSKNQWARSCTSGYQTSFFFPPAPDYLLDIDVVCGIADDDGPPCHVPVRGTGRSATTTVVPDILHVQKPINMVGLRTVLCCSR